MAAWCHLLQDQRVYVTAMVGGLEFDRSEFNHAVQACRQPGSTYKPIYCSLALDRGYGYGTLLNDIPRAEVDPIIGEVWIPQNLNNTFEYQVNLEYALVWAARFLSETTAGQPCAIFPGSGPPAYAPTTPAATYARQWKP